MSESGGILSSEWNKRSPDVIAAPVSVAAAAVVVVVDDAVTSAELESRLTLVNMTCVWRRCDGDGGTDVSAVETLSRSLLRNRSGWSVMLFVAQKITDCARHDRMRTFFCLGEMSVGSNVGYMRRILLHRRY